MADKGALAWFKPTWYQTLTALSGVLLLILAQKELWDAAILAAGFVCVGIGEWINHPERIDVIPGMRALKGRINTRLPHWLGWTFDGVGVVLVVAGVCALLLRRL